MVLRIGIADDLRYEREMLTRMLQTLKHEVIFQAESGQDLVEACLRHRVDLVITDNSMPGLSGVDAAAQIYQRCRLPVILLSARCDLQLMVTAELHHVLVYLVKPVEQSNLERAISLALRRFNESQVDDNGSTPVARGSKVDEASTWRRTIGQLRGQQSF
jgi:response regulator NasT